MEVPALLAIGTCDSVRACDRLRGGGLISFMFFGTSLRSDAELAGVVDLEAYVLVPLLARWDGGPLPKSMEEGGGIAADGQVYALIGLK